MIFKKEQENDACQCEGIRHNRLCCLRKLINDNDSNVPTLFFPFIKISHHAFYLLVLHISYCYLYIISSKEIFQLPASLFSSLE